MPTELLTDKGAVSEEVAVSMAQGVREKLGTDYSIAITGYAGPGGGPEAPVGTIWIAIGTPNDIQTRQLTGDEGRETNLVKATLMALEMLKARLQVDFPLEETDEE